MLLARPAPELVAPSMPTRVPRAIAATEGRGPLAPVPAAGARLEPSRARPERTALWFWAEPSQPDAP